MDEEIYNFYPSPINNLLNNPVLMKTEPDNPEYDINNQISPVK